MTIQNIKSMLLLMVLTVSTLLANITQAQKQPQIQETNLLAPTNIKVDGTLNEWQNKYLSAYNDNNRIYYTISNSDNYLFITIRGLGTRVTLKALTGGVTITVSQSLDKKNRAIDANNVSITFPLPQEDKTIQNIMNPIRLYQNFKDDTVAYKKQIDSLANITNKRMAEALTTIKVIGIKDISEQVISIYNTEGFKAKAQVSGRAPIFEMAIPLKYLGMSAQSNRKFSYNIKFNGPPKEPDTELILDKNGVPNADQFYVEHPTDLWGEYTIARKL